ncbi:MAG: hypothetical protein KF773_40670 [Deltaproteobacteria bacterium]|nr:hypothetical protein [Deltaproteobacteria bacterium]
MRAAIWSAVLLTACAHTVHQNARTGEDGKISGAKKIELVDGEARVKDIVTYPGGDRVDWKAIELPAGKSGTLDLEMTYKPPRPGLKVVFEVYNQEQRPVEAKYDKRGRTRSTSIENASGKYFIRVYAPKRGDAAAYVLNAKFQAITPEPPVTYKDLPVPPPPNLADVVATRPCTTYDVTNPACELECPSGSPREHKGCKLAEERAKAEEAERIRKAECATKIAAWQTAVAAAQANIPKPLDTRFTSREVKGSELELTIAGGSKLGVTKQWKATLVRNGKPVPGGALRIVFVNDNDLKARTSLPSDSIKDARILLEPDTTATVLPPRPPGC